MVRTVISLSSEDKAWLDRAAAARGVPMTEVVRQAIRVLRASEPVAGPTFEELLEMTAGTWQEGDGLAWQRRMRAEWDDRGP